MRRQSGAVSGPRVGRALVAFQIAMATTLVAGSLTLVRTLEVMRAQDPGFRRSKLIVMTLNPRMAGIKSEGIAQVFKDILQRAATLSGVEAASLAEKAPMRGIGLKASVLPAGSRVATTDVLNVSLNNVSLEHFQNIGMRLLKGRGFVPRDDNGKPRPAIVSKSFSRRFFPNVEPIGQAVGNGGVNEVTQAKYQIVGIVNDSKYRSMREIPPPTLIVRDAAWTVLPGILPIRSLRPRARAIALWRNAVECHILRRRGRSRDRSHRPSVGVVALASSWFDEWLPANLSQCSAPPRVAPDPMTHRS